MILAGSFLIFALLGQPAFAQNQEKDKATIFVSPHLETVLTGSVFDVSVFLDTHGNSINTVELNLQFSPDKLRIIAPSGGKSFFSIWHDVPVYSNEKGTAKFIGGITNGITTESGLITTITFEAKTSGQAVVEILPSSKVLANDGTGANILTGLGKGIYEINIKPPEGISVFSETHPFQDRWYNNKNPILVWEKNEGINDFSFELDNKPQTIPDNNPETQNTITSYENLGDGIWFFHIKARQESSWGSTTHFPLHIDASPPMPFKPTIEVLTAAITNRVLITFSATDLLSGINHYEIGIIDKTKSPVESPAFVRTESPYQLPNLISGNLRVMVRAIDNAGNVRDESMDINMPFSPKIIYIGGTIFFLLLILLHYLFGHHILARFRRAWRFMRTQEMPKQM